MNPLAEYAGTTLACIQPSILKQEYELRSGADIVGNLVFPSVFARKCHGTAGENTWVVEQKGFLNPRIVVSSQADKVPVAEFDFSSFSLCKIRLPHWRILRLRRNVWKGEVDLSTDMNFPLLNVKTRGIKAAAEVTLTDRSAAFPELSWLVFTVLFVALSGKKGKGPQ